MLKQLEVAVKTLAPVIISTSYDSTVMTESESYIRGSILRGVLAGAYLRQAGRNGPAEKDEKFRRLFLGGLHFIDAYPVSQGQRAFPIPKSLMREKNSGVIMDLLQPGAGARVNYKKISGLGVVRDHTLFPVMVEKDIAFHMSRHDDQEDTERLSGRSENGKIFNYECIRAGQTFSGFITGEEKDLRDLKQALGSVVMGRIGKSHYTGYGAMRLTLGDMESLPVSGKEGTTLYFRLDTPLLSYGLAWDGRTLLEKVVEEIGKAAKRTDLTLDKVFAAPFTTSRFISVWGLKSPTLYGLEAGSVFSVTAKKPWTANADVAERLSRGFGADREDGFGEVSLWDRQVADMKTALPVKAAAPAAFPDVVREKARQILLNRVKEAVQLDAYDDVRKSTVHLAGMTHALAKLEDCLGDRKELDGFRQRFCHDFPAKLEGYASLASHLEASRLSGKTLNLSLKEWLLSGKIPARADSNCAKWLADIRKEPGLLEALGGPLSEEEKDALFYEYWFWFCRHGRKQAQEKAGQEGREA